MMLRLIFRHTLLLMIVFVSSVLVIHARPPDNTDVPALLTPSADCPAPCFLGVRPGDTTVADAITLLRAHEWIGEARVNAPGNGYADIRWTWSGQQPDLIDITRPARMTFYWSAEDPVLERPEEARIDLISFYTTIRMHNAQTWYGDPDSGAANFRLDDMLGYSAAYHNAGSTLGLSTAMPCPLTLLTYWEARVKITMTIGQGNSQFVPLPDLMQIC